jgi:hypothetical protein
MQGSVFAHAMHRRRRREHWMSCAPLPYRIHRPNGYGVLKLFLVEVLLGHRAIELAHTGSREHRHI